MTPFVNLLSMLILIGVATIFKPDGFGGYVIFFIFGIVHVYIMRVIKPYVTKITLEIASETYVPIMDIRKLSSWEDFWNTLGISTWYNVRDKYEVDDEIYFMTYLDITFSHVIIIGFNPENITTFQDKYPFMEFLQSLRCYNVEIYTFDL